MDSDQTRELDRLAAILSRPNAGLVLDLDGAIQLEAGEGGAPVIDPRLRGIVERLVAARVQVAFVSGRSASRVRHAVGLRGPAYFGRHGMERIQRGRPERESANRWAGARLGKLATTLQQRLAGYPATVEDRGVDLVVTVDQGHDIQAVRRRMEAVMRDVSLPRQFVILAEGQQLAVVQHPAASREYLVRSLMREWVTEGIVYVGGTAWDAQAMERMLALLEEDKVAGVLCRTDGPEGLVTRLDYTGVPALLSTLERRRTPPALPEPRPRPLPAPRRDGPRDGGPPPRPYGPRDDRPRDGGYRQGGPPSRPYGPHDDRPRDGGYRQGGPPSRPYGPRDDRPRDGGYRQGGPPPRPYGPREDRPREGGSRQGGPPPRPYGPRDDRPREGGYRQGGPPPRPYGPRDDRPREGGYRQGGPPPRRDDGPPRRRVLNPRMPGPPGRPQGRPPRAEGKAGDEAGGEGGS